MLFGIPNDKDAQGSGSWDDQGPVPRAIKQIKAAAPNLVVWADVCLCEYTDHGHCGVLTTTGVDNDASLPLLARAAVLLRARRRRRDRAVRHDGRPRRRDSRGAR